MDNITDTREALIGSIKKWDDIVYSDGVDDSDRNCPLCQMFYDDGCADCPVQLDTGFSYCNATPYVDWSRITHTLQPPHTLEDALTINPNARDVAKAELEYLKGLLKQ